MDMNIDTSRSYATEANLRTALERFGFAECPHVVVRTRTGRWTAVFPVSSVSFPERHGGGYLGRFACQGFLTIG